MSSTTPPQMTYPILPSKLILTSTKAYFSPTQTLQYLKDLLAPPNAILPVPSSEILFALIPDYLTIYPCAQLLGAQYGQALQSWPLLLGAQDAFWDATYGPYTGEIVPAALKELGVSIVELGHAERRRLLAETDETTARKAAAASSLGMVPLVCIGETERPNLNGPLSASVGATLRHLTSQVESVLVAVPKEAPVILAYEPVWAIGATEPASVEYVGPVVQAVRELIKGVEAKTGRTGQTKVVYGGSAGPGLWSGTANGGNALGQWVDGMFLGRFALETGEVKKVVDEVIQTLH